MSFVKVIAPGAYDWKDELAVQMVKVASGGLRGHDLRSFIKRAGHLFADAMKHIKLGSGEVPIHMLAVGATEYYGMNRNGDAFSQLVCDKFHPTFVKHARWYRQHQNKNPARSYGVVKMSAYNPDMHRIELLVALNGNKEAAAKNGGLVADEEMEKLANEDPIAVSMACFPPGTPVGLADGTETAIDQIQLGTKVVTHHGNVGEVEALMVRDYDGNLVRFRASGLPDDVVSTANHRIWVRPSLRGKSPRCPVCSRQFKSLKAHLRQMPDAQHRAAYKDYSRYAEGWVRAEDLTPGDYVRTPFSTAVEEQGDETYAELLGFYLSEGNTFYYKKSPSQAGVDFSFSKTEQTYVSRVIKLLTELGYTRIHVYARKNNVRLVRVTSPELAARLEADAGRYSWGKALAPRFMLWSPAVQMKLFAAFMCGDGHFHKTHCSLVATTVSRRLAFQLAAICWRNGIPARIGAYSPATKRRAYTVHVQESHIAAVSCDKVPDGFEYRHATRQLGHLKHQNGGAWTGTCSTTLAYVENGFVYRRVVRVATEHYCGPVHNITVSVDSSYTVNGVAVSNCRVPFDVCSVCHNRARNRDEYCTGTDEGGMCKGGGLKHHIASVLDDGTQLYADNTEPTFFDISRVFRPADRIAWVTGQLKAASHAVVSGADLAAEWGVTVPAFVSDNEKQARWAELAGRLAEEERKVEAGEGPHRYYGLAFMPEVQPAVDWGGHHVKAAEAMHALIRERISPPLEGFIRMGVMDPVKSAAVAEAARRYLPGIYGRMLDDGTIGSVDVDPSNAGGVPPLRARLWAEKMASDYSLRAEQADRRARRAGLYHAMPPVPLQGCPVKVAGAALEVAKAYALFKLAMLDRAQQEGDKDFDVACVLAVRQNYV